MLWSASRLAICVFPTISYSIVKCSFVCLFVNALDPCKINIKKYTSVMLFLRFPAKYSPNYSRTLTCVHVCLSVWLAGCVSVMFGCGGGGLCLCVYVCLSVCAVLCKVVCVFVISVLCRGVSVFVCA